MTVHSPDLRFPPTLVVIRAGITTTVEGKAEERLRECGYLTSNRSITKTSVLPDSRCPPPAGPYAFSGGMTS